MPPLFSVTCVSVFPSVLGAEGQWGLDMCASNYPSDKTDLFPVNFGAEGEAVISEESSSSSCLHLKGRANADRVSMQHIRFTQGF